ncbi:carbon-nitrogen family hydrolase [Salicibibacter cibarius]|uniref:Carbon-nitrogen family hydrolase n=2 Tax=Salicibibacter cibarius TaxID=2743000 RepID=A0A7T6Z7C9_9BACI|nr:carbon-nitrogen family hydrolase [Salicibibacter cibarius]QQK78301.1 carbon-nitrogen family hydrolase [Salicibibacter cibarius]
MKIALYQMNVQAGKPETNRAKVQQWLKDVAERHQPDVAVLPEMWTTGYTLSEIAQLADEENGQTQQMLKSLAKEHKIDLVAGSIAVKTADGVVNRALTISGNGEVISEYDKIHLVPMLDEPRYLAAGKDKVRPYELQETTMGSFICYDLRFPEIARSLAVNGAKVIYVFGEWPEARRDHWDALLRARAIENQCFIVAAGAVGSHDGPNFSGHSTVISPWGNVLALASPDEEETLVATIDLSEVDEFREAVPVLKNRLPARY